MRTLDQINEMLIWLKKSTFKLNCNKLKLSVDEKKSRSIMCDPIDETSIESFFVKETKIKFIKNKIDNLCRHLLNG